MNINVLRFITIRVDRGKTCVTKRATAESLTIEKRKTMFWHYIIIKISGKEELSLRYPRICPSICMGTNPYDAIRAAYEELDMGRMSVIIDL